MLDTGIIPTTPPSRPIYTMSLTQSLVRPFASPFRALTVSIARTASTRTPISDTLSRTSLRRDEENRLLDNNLTRRWRPGDVYSPHDLSAAEMRKWRDRGNAPKTDAFDALSLNPLDLYKNFSVMSEYVTEMGRIRGRKSTGLRRVNQRRLAKAIRRARMLGLMPSVHRHPMIIRAELERSGSFL